MGYTQYAYYESDDVSIEQEDWDFLAMFAARAAKHVKGVTCETTDDLIVIDANPGGENLVMQRDTAGAERRSGGRKFFFCKTARLPYDAVIVATLIAAQQVGLIEKWSSDGNTNDTRPGIDLYYKVSDEFFEECGRNWWEPPPKSHAKAAAAFHTKWKEMEPDLMNLAAAAQALASVRGGSTTLVQLLEELNDILMDEFNLTNRPFVEDPEGVDTHGMLEAWRSELFDLVVTREVC